MFVGFCCLRDPEVGEALPGEVDVSLDILADDGLLVGAGNVVPFDAITVEVVENGHAGLSLSPLTSLAVVGLTDPGATGPKVCG